MESNKIVGIKEIVNKKNMCTVTYDVMGINKEVLYSLNSNELLNCVNIYLKFLKRKEKKLDNKKDNEIFKKKLVNNILIAIFALLVIYFIMSIAVHSNYLVGVVGYVFSLAIIIMSFIFASGLAYRAKREVLEEIDKNTKEILMVENLKERINSMIEKK